jgi:hypothetical protein
MEDLNASEDLSCQEDHVKNFETSERVTRNKRIKMCKVQWSHHTKEGATWEREEELKAKFLFSIRPNVEEAIHFKGRRFVTPYFSQKNETTEIIYLICKCVCCIHVVAKFLFSIDLCY